MIDELKAKGMAPEPEADEQMSMGENCIEVDDSMYPDLNDGDPITFKGKGTFRKDDDGSRIEVSEVDETPISAQQQDDDEMEAKLDSAVEQMASRHRIETTR